MSAKHMVQEIERLKDRIIALGDLVEDRVHQSIQSVVGNDSDRALNVIKGDREIDQLEVELEEECLKLLALYQPVASDLRFIVSVLKINNDLERIGDLAANIAHRGRSLMELDMREPFPYVEDMAEQTKEMLRNSLRSLVNLDLAQAQFVRAADDGVDELNRRIHQEVKTRLHKDSSQTEFVLLFLSISKHLERIADLASNIAEDVVYLIEGDIVRHSGTPASPTEPTPRI